VRQVHCGNVDVRVLQIFLETLRARVTLLLSEYHESLAQSSSSPESSRDSLQLACELLTDLQVETYSSMEPKEKTKFILQQMRLLVAVARQKDAALKKDVKDPIGGGEAEWIKVRVSGRKINEDFLKIKENEVCTLAFSPSFLQPTLFQPQKRQYYELMIQHALNQGAYLDVAQYYNKVWETPSIKEDVDGEGKAVSEHGHSRIPVSHCGFRHSKTSSTSSSLPHTTMSNQTCYTFSTETPL
jgi:26S proteasome regulatory subunit N5